MLKRLIKVSSTKSKTGFTIVELLVVIVVIGILASIVIVSYGGIVQKARNLAITHNVDQYRKALILYKTLNNDNYPASMGSSACLGTGYDDTNSDGTGDCGDPNMLVSEVSAYNTDMRTVIKSLPKINTYGVFVPVSIPSRVWHGAYVSNNSTITVEGVTEPYVISYVLFGSNVKCGLQGSLAQDNDAGGYPRMKYGDNAWYDANSTQCLVSLPTDS